ncbi:hypothetical protein ACQY0O_001085 [Thecaphora frezii]
MAAHHDQATPAETQAALHRSRTFLTTRLLPDLDAAQRHHDAITAELQAIYTLRHTLRTLDAQSSLSPSADKHQHQQADTLTAFAEVGEGVVVQTNLNKHDMPIVSLGLAGFYAQLTNREARAFLTKRADLVQRKQQRALEKVAQIEAHIHLTSTSISQLDNLYRGGSIVDDL